MNDHLICPYRKNYRTDLFMIVGGDGKEEIIGEKDNHRVECNERISHIVDNRLSVQIIVLCVIQFYIRGMFCIRKVLKLTKKSNLSCPEL